VLVNGSDGQRSSLLKNKSKWISLFFYIAPYRTIDRSVFKPIIQISVMDRSESSDCHLLAVTHAGKETNWHGRGNRGRTDIIFIAE
jgi:nuclear pore complex protein Nup155